VGSFGTLRAGDGPPAPFRPDGQDRHLASGEALKIPELLPGFKLPIDELLPAAATKP
jgi:hypothetical protein